MAASFNILHVILALLIGIYTGINLSGFHVQSPSAALSQSLRQPTLDTTDETTHQNHERELQQYLSEVKRWKDQAKKLENEYASSLNRLHKLEESCTEDGAKQRLADVDAEDRPPPSSSSSSLPYTNPHPICQHALPQPTPTATAIWNDKLLKVLAASRVPNDSKYKFHDFTTQLLQIVSPRLVRSVKTLPNDWRPVERALTIAWERYQYLQLPLDKRKAVARPPRPLKILIMGGSLLVGTNCRMLLTELGLQFRLPKRDCTWSNRVGQFLNSFFGATTQGSLVEVTKVAMGGTNTATGSVIWQYDLVPEESRNPDIVLNAYSTNDMHILTVLEAQSSNTTLRDRTFDMMQSFVRQVLQTTSCPDGRSSESHEKEHIPPLLLHMDDYLGNEQRKIWETTEMMQGVQVLANYYGFGSMSYSDFVRDLVYGDTYETWLSSEWWKPPEKKKKANGFENSELVFEREIHPGMGMHIASTWVVAYYLLHVTTVFCSLPTPGRPYDLVEYEAGLWGLPELHKDVPQAKGKPQSRIPPGIIPPVLTKELLLQDVTALWQEQVAEQTSRQEHHHSTMCATGDDSENGHPTLVKCPFSWVSNLSLQQNNKTWIREYFERQSSTWKGWELSDDGGKIGFVPNISGGAISQMVLDFQFPHQDIRSITLFFMKSYGPKWRDSQLEARLFAADQPSVVLDKRDLFGTHAKNTSEMYTEEIVLTEPVGADQKLQLEARLMGGETFKIMGLAVCS